MKKILLFLCIGAFIACSTEPKEVLNETETPSIKNKTTTEYTYLTVQNQNSEWGYQLFKDGQLMINQQNIPAIQGNKGFSSKNDAEKIATYILEKVKKGEFPPTISVEELDSLGVL
jgi:hypothetical protein